MEANLKIACATYIATILIENGKVPVPTTDAEGERLLTACLEAFERFVNERFVNVVKPIPTINAIMPTGTN